MKLLPFAKMTLWSALQPGEVALRLKRMVAPKEWWPSTEPPDAFNGSFDGRHFTLFRRLNTWFPYHSGFQPLVVGELRPQHGGTSLPLVMRLGALGAAFLSVWCGGLLLMAVLAVLAAWREGLGSLATAPDRPHLPIGLFLIAVAAMLALGYALVCVPFWLEVGRSQRLLCKELSCGEPPVPSDGSQNGR